MDPKDLHLAATEAIGRSEAKIRAKLLKRLRKHGLTDQDAGALVEAWKRAAVNTKDLEVPARTQKPPNSHAKVGQ